MVFNDAGFPSRLPLDKHNTPEPPPFCGFAVPTRISLPSLIFKKRPDKEKEQYARIEKLWDALWAGISGRRRPQTARVTVGVLLCRF